MTFVAVPQFPVSRFAVRRYNKKPTWTNYWYQIDAILKANPKRVLEIGPGNMTVADMLRKAGVEVVTVDIDPELKPDHVASVTDLPFQDSAFDAVLCCEVLEHLPYECFVPALRELRRVTGQWLILGLPHAGAVISYDLKLPLLPRLTLFTKIPFFWKEHRFADGHYWETGKRDYGRDRIRSDIKAAGFSISRERINPDDPAHWLLDLEKIS
jgi:SAM-dependent methyltransferase